MQIVAQLEHSLHKERDRLQVRLVADCSISVKVKKKISHPNFYFDIS